MQHVDDKEVTTREKNGKTPWKGILGIVIIVLFVVGVINFRSCSSKKDVEKYAQEQLLSRSYSVIELTVVESHSSSKNEDEGGKVNFTVRDRHGLLIEGKADIVIERNWLFKVTKTFKTTSLKPKK